VYHNVTRRRPPPPPPDEPERKEKVIHTRVPESLEAELRQRAQDLGISVSNLVRNVLGHAFGLVGDIMADGASVARAARGDRSGSGAITGWQPIVLGVAARCRDCKTELPRGSDAAIAIVDGDGPRPMLCTACLEEVRHGDE
jgi:hypothetical protein